MSDEVGDAPLAVELLSTPLVVWRSESRFVAFHDRCVHRSAPLSMGRVADGRLVCGFHGWHYGPTGSCTGIPSLPEDLAIPDEARVATFDVAERHGLVWVCLGKPAAPIPEFPAAFRDPAFRWDRVLKADVRANAARFMENTMDLSHFAWVHAGVLASDEQVAPIEVRPRDDGFEYDLELPTVQLDLTRSRYRLIFPFTLYIDQYAPDSPVRQVLIFLCSPITSRRMTVFRLGGRNYTRMSEEDELARAQLVFEQDQRFVEAQRPEELPLDLRDELHVRGPDSAAIEYRRRLSAAGVTWT